MNPVDPSRFFQNNPAFKRAVEILAGADGWVAMGLLAANDLVFKRVWPGWVSGKLSDAAGLVLLAYLATAAAGILIPWLRARPRAAWLIACAGTGIGFGWLKLDPALAAWASAALPVRLVPDPTDLIALAALIPAGLIFLGSSSAPRTSIRSREYAALALASLLVMADAAAPDMGIHCLVQGEQGLIAEGGYGAQFSSTDGGVNWQTMPNTGNIGAGKCASAVDGATTIEAPGTQTKFRVFPDVSIERSEDGGAVWAQEANLQPFNQRERAYIEKTRSGTLIFPGRPLAALFDAGSGNLVLAMGYEGVLLRKPNGAWTSAPVGGYRPRSLESDGIAGILTLLFGELLLAGMTALTIFSLLSVRTQPRKYDWIRLVINALLWAGILLVFPPALTNRSYIQGAVLLCLLAAELWALAWAVADAIRLKGRSLLLLIWAILAGIFFFIPYIFWGVGILAAYSTAAALALALAATCAVLAWIRHPNRSGQTL